MNKFKILIVALFLMPTLVLAQTTLDSSVDSSIDSRTSLDTSVSNTDPTNIDTNTTTTSLETKTEEEVIEDIRVFTDGLDEINTEKKLVESELRAEIRDSINDSIRDIRTQVNVEAYELQGVVDDTRNTVYRDINETISNTSDSQSVRELGDRIESAVSDIERNLRNKSGANVDLSENLVNIKNTLLRYEQIIEEKENLIQDRTGDLLQKDTDGDGISDYDEIFIYKTDPENPFSVPGELNDREKIERGINPSDPEGRQIEYQDPRQDRKSVISKVHRLESVELVSASGAGSRLKLQGSALPNSFVTIYIFSTPTIVTVRSDARGQWSYTMDKELDNGVHEVYVATVDNSGRLIARSEGIPITQSAEAATLGTFGIGESTPQQNDFVQENFILIILSILLFAVIVVLILSGNSKKEIPNDTPPQMPN